MLDFVLLARYDNMGCSRLDPVDVLVSARLAVRFRTLEMVYWHSILQRAADLASSSEMNRPIVLPSTVSHHLLGAYLAACHIQQPLVSRISLHISLNGRRSRHACI